MQQGRGGCGSERATLLRSRIARNGAACRSGACASVAALRS
jgi:hypothetical protein